LVHNGRLSTLKALCDRDTVDQVAQAFADAGASVEVHDHRETPEQREERARHLQLFTPSGPTPWQTPKCPSCAWIAPELKSYCGLGRPGPDGWAKEAQDKLLEQEQYRLDADNCPLSGTP